MPSSRGTNQKQKLPKRQSGRQTRRMNAKPNREDNLEFNTMENRDNQQYHFFWKSGSPFSQWHPSRYELNGIVYHCAEQGMMHGKAMLFRDYTVAEEILYAQSPRKMKALGRKVRNFKPKLWNQHREQIVYENNVAKFTQNHELFKALMKTKGLLVEASPSDRIWGIGLSEAKARLRPSSEWPGMNLLGSMLTRVRDDLRFDCGAPIDDGALAQNESVDDDDEYGSMRS